MELQTSHKRTSGQLSVLRRFQALARDGFRMRRHPPAIGKLGAETSDPSNVFLIKDYAGTGAR